MGRFRSFLSHYLRTTICVGIDGTRRARQSRLAGIENISTHSRRDGLRIVQRRRPRRGAATRGRGGFGGAARGGHAALRPQARRGTRAACSSRPRTVTGGPASARECRLNCRENQLCGRLPPEKFTRTRRVSSFRRTGAEQGIAERSRPATLMWDRFVKADPLTLIGQSG